MTGASRGLAAPARWRWPPQVLKFWFTMAAVRTKRKPLLRKSARPGPRRYRRGRSRTADGAHKLARQTRAIVGDRLDILVAKPASQRPRPSRKRPSRISTSSLPSMSAHPSSSCSNCFRSCRRQQHRPDLLACRACLRWDAPGLCGDEGRHRHAGEALRIRAWRTRHSRQRGGARGRRDRYVELHQDRCGARFHSRHAGLEAPRATGRHRCCRRIPGVQRGPLDHRRYCPRGRRLEALSFSPSATSSRLVRDPSLDYGIPLDVAG